MLNIKHKKISEPFIDSEKKNQNMLSYLETNKIKNSYSSLENENFQLSSTDYYEYYENNQKIINIKHAQKTKNFRQGIELNKFIGGHHGWQLSGVDLYDNDLGQLTPNSIKNYFEESSSNEVIFIDSYESEIFDISIYNNLSFEIVNKSGIIEPLAVRDLYVAFQDNVPQSWKLFNTIKGTLQSGDNLTIENQSNQFDISYKSFTPYKDLFDAYTPVGGLLNNNVLNQNLLNEKISILGNDDFYFENITSIAYSGLKYFNVHKHQNIEITVDHQIDYWGSGLLFDTPLNSTVNIITETTGSGRNVSITGYLTGHAQITYNPPTNSTGSNYPSRFEFSIGYNTAPAYINPEIAYAGYFTGSILHQNISGKYEVPDGTTYYNIPVIFTDHNNSLNDPNLGNGLTIDVTIKKSFISSVKINNYGNNYPKGEFRYGIAENALFSGSEESTGIGILKIK